MKAAIRYLCCLLFLPVGGLAVALDVDSPPETHITSDRLEVDDSNLEITRFLFEGNVVVTSPHLQTTCDRLEVLLESPIGLDKDRAPDIEGISKVIAIGNVKIQEEQRTATAGRAEIYPKEGKIVLTDNPIVEDNEGIVRGYRMTLYRNQRRAMVEGSMPDGERPTVLLPPLPTFGGLTSEQETTSDE